MKALLRRGDWLTGLLILSMPITLVFFLGSQMAYGQVQRQFVSYAALPEYTSLAEVQALPAGATILLRGQIADPATVTSLLPEAAPVAPTEPLLVYQERPLDGREVRYLEEFPLIFPALALTLADGVVGVQPSQEGAPTISHELQRITVDDRAFTGFQVGDTITVQGKWQPAAEQSLPLLVEVTGIAGVAKAALQTEVQAALQKVKLVRDGLGLLALAGMVLLGIRLYRYRRNPPPQPEPFTTDEGAARTWQTATNETAPSI
ncbi:MAG: hypothetical protein DYG89_50550 [Caldilinea sp. CFX5]|nr:hypothetical protein [Caldilinea sp. CFX5]